MKRRIKAIAAAAAIIAPVAVMAAPVEAQAAPSIYSLAIVGQNWDEPISGDYTVYEDELPTDWSIQAFSNAESMTWEVAGQGVVLRENEQPYLIARNSATSYDPAGYGPGTYEITATAHAEDNQEGAETAQTVTLTIEPGTRPGVHFMVNSTIDQGDTTPGDGVCGYVAFGSTQCTLRAAVEEANALGGGSIGVKPREGTFGYVLSGGELVIRSGIAVKGIAVHGNDAKPRISANNVSRVFRVIANKQIVLFNNLRLMDGYTPDTGGIIGLNAGIVWIQNSELSGGNAERGGAVGVMHTTSIADGVLGAALQIDNSVLTENSATYSGGAVDTGWRSPNSDLSRVSINSSFLTNNSVTDGGEVGAGRGGAIHSGREVQFVLHNSVVADNTSSILGSGVHISDSDATISWSTIADNQTKGIHTSTADNEEAGGLYTSDVDRTDVHHSVLVGNTAWTRNGFAGADCGTESHQSFEFGPGNYVGDLGFACRFNTSPISTPPRGHAFSDPAPYSNKIDMAGGKVRYEVDVEGPIAEHGLEGLSSCPTTFDVVGVRHDAVDCASGAFAIQMPSPDETDEPNNIDTQAIQSESAEIQSPSLEAFPIPIDQLDIGGSTSILEPSGSSIPQLDLGALSLG